MTAFPGEPPRPLTRVRPAPSPWLTRTPDHLIACLCACFGSAPAWPGGCTVESRLRVVPRSIAGMSSEDRTPCPNITSCPMFPRFRVKEALNVWIIKYCEDQFASCSRFKAKASGKPVPPALLPNGRVLSLPRR